MNQWLKIPFVAFGIPITTWVGINAYWSCLRWSGEVPLYYKASMVGLRALLHAPLQALAVGMLAILFRKSLVRVSMTRLGLACAVASPLAVLLDACGMHYSRLEALTTANRFWDVGPHVVGPTILMLLVCIAPPAANHPGRHAPVLRRPPRT